MFNNSISKNILKHYCVSVYRCKYESKYDTKEMLLTNKMFIKVFEFTYTGVFEITYFHIYFTKITLQT
jgi:hypothetical protein